MITLRSFVANIFVCVIVSAGNIQSKRWDKRNFLGIYESSGVEKAVEKSFKDFDDKRRMKLEIIFLVFRTWKFFVCENLFRVNRFVWVSRLIILINDQSLRVAKQLISTSTDRFLASTQSLN